MMILWLKRILKYSLILLLMLILAIVSWLGYYYIKEIHPYKPIIENILANADPENRYPPKQVVEMVEAQHYCPVNRFYSIFDGKIQCIASIEQFSAKGIVFKNNSKLPTIHRHLHELGLSWMIYESLTFKDRHALYAELSYAGYGKNGFNHFAKQHFGKPLSGLTIDESATLVAVLKGPSYYLKQPERLEERKNIVLERYKSFKQSE